MFSITDIPASSVHHRRLTFLALWSVVFLLGFIPMVNVLASGGLGLLDVGILGLFAVLFGQVALGVSMSLVGYWVLRHGGDRFRITQTLPPETAPGPLPSTAIVMPIFNEEVQRVMQGVRAMFHSLQRTGRSDAFDFFVLSDSNNPNHWIEEEKTWLELCRDVNGFGRIFYRKRRIQLHHKSGNIADFCRRWGARYRYMIVLDADSIMSGCTMVRLVELMERNRSVGMIQTPPQMVMGHSLFRRVQQFAARLYGPIFMAGAHFWHLGGGNYWGHNAIIRLRLFMNHCALPELPRLGPLGGRILSHDTVEAAFMRRAGYGVWVATDLEGSYEEGPPELIASLQRDRRWCQGNIQHLLVLFRRGLRLTSRLHILLGILAYASAPLWFLSIVLTTLSLFLANSQFKGAAFGPWWQQPAFKSGLLFAYVMLLLLIPKFLGVLHWAGNAQGLKRFGGGRKVLLSLCAEVAFSALLAPILMVFYTKFVLATLTGGTVHWGPQRRGEERPSWSELLAVFGGQTVWGLFAWSVLGWVAPAAVPWLIPVLLGWTFSIPFARITSSTRLGVAARAKGWFVIPEETAPPQELSELAQEPCERPSPFFEQETYAQNYGLLQVILDPYLHALHVSLLRMREPVSERTRGYSSELRTKLLANGPEGLTSEERTNLLWDAEALVQLHKELWIAPGERLHVWWRRALRHYNEASEIATRRRVTR